MCLTSRSEPRANSDPLAALADRYLRRRPAPAFFKDARPDKFRYLFDLIRVYRVEGVIWYSPLYRDGYDRWAVFFARALEKESGIPFLKIVSDYDPSEAGTMRTASMHSWKWWDRGKSCMN